MYIGQGCHGGLLGLVGGVGWHHMAPGPRSFINPHLSHAGSPGAAEVPVVGGSSRPSRGCRM